MRTFDLILAVMALCFLFPLFVLVIILLRFTGEGEILFLQDRVGLNGRRFKVYKFATMLKNSPNMGSGTITSKNDPRILPLGKFLRKTKINELPQIVNIIGGEMSLIGPRPHAERDLFGIESADLEIISSMRPGLSGIGSLIFRNEEEILSNFEAPRDFYDTVVAPYKAKLEVWYFNERTFGLNIILILLTVYVIFTGHNKSAYNLFRSLPPIPEQLKPYL